MNLSKAFELLRILLNDKDWTVKNAAMESLHNLSKDSKDTTIAMKIVDLIDDDEKWTRLKALEITAEIIKKNPEVLSINKMKNLIISKDPDIRGQVGNILGSYDADKFDVIFPLIIDLMVDSDSNVRNKASSALVSISVNVPMKKFLPATLIYFSDETEIILQQSIALALKRIIKYESKEIKKRVIDLLTIRAEVSQDPVISKVLQDLKD
jgi:HEAT repeat protein